MYLSNRLSRSLGSALLFLHIWWCLFRFGWRLGVFRSFGVVRTQAGGHTGGCGPVQAMDGSCLWRGRYRV